MSSTKTALIFGAGGFVGPYLAREFSIHGYRVVGSDRSGECSSDEVDSCYGADLLDGDAVERIIKTSHPDVIVNLAAISSVGQSWSIPQATMQVNVVGSLNILEAAKGMESAPKILLVGSSEEYAPSNDLLSEDSPVQATSPYGVSKEAQERFAEIYAERFGLEVYRVRAFNHTGIGQCETFVLPSFCKQVAEIERSGKPGIMRVGNLHVCRDFSDVRDVVRAYRMVVESDRAGEVFNVGSGIACLLSDLLDSIISCSDQEIAVEIDPGKLRPVDVPTILCDRSKIGRLVGWEPEHFIEQTLAGMVRNYLV